MSTRPSSVSVDRKVKVNWSRAYFSSNSQAAGRRRPQPIERPRFNGRIDIWISFRPAWISFRLAWNSFRLAWISFHPAWNSFRPAWSWRQHLGGHRDRHDAMVAADFT